MKFDLCQGNIKSRWSMVVSICIVRPSECTLQHGPALCGVHSAGPCLSSHWGEHASAKILKSVEAGLTTKVSMC